MSNGHVMPHCCAAFITGSALEQLLAGFLLWTAMMVAMMLPTALPAINLFGTFARKRLPSVGRAVATSWFVLGYSAIWAGYSLLAATGQLVLSRSGFLPPASHGTSIALSATMLVTAGAFQFSRLKEACLSQCRSPFPFLLAHWRDGDLGAFLLGARHGSYCLGCCWALMGLMWIFGSMNLLWMGALSLWMLAEKMAPARWQLSRVGGVVCIVAGTVLAVRAVG